jgi:anti-sigma regulatory factor (Ser/Thr protein kinase)
MLTFHVISLLVYAFGVYACGSVLVHMLRSLREGTDGSGRPGCTTRAVRWNLVLVGLCGFWFMLHTLRELLVDSDLRNWLDLVRFNLSLLFPPILNSSNYHEVNERTPLPQRGWRWGIALGWIVAPLCALYCDLAIFHVVSRPASINALIGLSFAVTFGMTAVFCALVLSIGRKHRETTDERRGRRSMVALYGVLLLFAALVVLATIRRLPIDEFLNLFGGSLPLVFMFTGTYHESRFEFVDLFVKRFVYFGVALAILAGFFAVVPPVTDGIATSVPRPFLLALLLLPVAIVLPWLHRRLSRWLDHVWLGRLLPPVEAIKRFLAGLRDAVTREQLIEQAERGLAAIFRAPAQVRLGSNEETDPAFDAAIEVPVRSAGEVVGTIRMGKRENHTPYFGEDRTLIVSLADVLSHMLENIDLQARRREQETRARELSLAATRSELKALRAQINPHFLFNALNAIAGLIHKDPGRADETLEQLAEIFRYTLRGSESEWAVLSEELDFVRSYLEVERARFGKRLEVTVLAPTDVATARLPTMLVQTLVENAVKHGVAVVRGQAKIEVEARVEDGSLVVEVRDSGPGFETPDPATHRPVPSSKRSGYGLRNVRERLAGHYGERASLTIRRDDERGLTIVALVLPFDATARQRSGVA